VTYFVANNYREEIKLATSCEGQVGHISLTPFDTCPSISLEEQNHCGTSKKRQLWQEGVQVCFSKIMRSVLQAENYAQIDREQKYYNIKKQVPVDIFKYRISVLSGYQVQVKALHDGFFLNVDTVTKFLVRDTVLDKIKQLLKENYSKADISALLAPSVSAEEEKTPAQSDKDSRRLFVLTTYFPQSYQIHSIVWDKTPTTHKMQCKRRENGKIVTSDLSLAQYLEAKYGIRGLDPK